MSESDKPQRRYALRIAKTAEKDLLDLQTKQFAQVAKKIFSLQGNPKPQDCAVLKGYSGGYRVDQGEYRILYTIDDEAAIVDIFRVGKRGESFCRPVGRTSSPNDGEVYRNL